MTYPNYLLGNCRTRPEIPWKRYHLNCIWIFRKTSWPGENRRTIQCVRFLALCKSALQNHWIFARINDNCEKGLNSFCEHLKPFLNYIIRFVRLKKNVHSAYKVEMPNLTFSWWLLSHYSIPLPNMNRGRMDGWFCPFTRWCEQTSLVALVRTWKIGWKN